jgi:tRNA nucleotidyltransferase (CCA-adding enzyme)
MVLNRLLDAGYDAYVVGGALRDMLLGRAAHDWDVATSALPEETARIFFDLSVIKTGLQHGTVTVLVDHEPIEVTTFRIDGDYLDARHPTGVTFTRCIEEDLARRDFTVNAMAYNNMRGLVDLYGGREDLSNGLIRAVGQAEKRFSEDALRILRAFRFMAKLGFDIDGDTLDAAVTCRDGLSRISAERVTAELVGLFEGKDAASALSLMIENGIFDAIAPDWGVPTFGFAALDSLPPVFEVRFAYFLRSCPDRGEGLMRHLRLSGKQSARIRGLLSLRDFDFAGFSESRIRRLVAAAGQYAEDLVPLLSVRDFFSLPRGTEERAIEAVERVLRRGDCLSVSALAVNGRMLMEIGFGGREIGTVLEKLLEAVLEEPSRNTSEELLSLARAMKNQ